MCGIVGLIAKDKTLSFSHREFFETMLVLDQVRGMDGTGVFGVFPNQQAHLSKVGTNASNFINLKAYDDFMSKTAQFKLMVGHNRKATMGSNSSKNSHPFHKGDILLVHNGTLLNHQTLDKNVDVDSEAIASILNDGPATDQLSRINGAFALAWFDFKSKLFNLARNEERPLFLAELEDAWAFASEPWMITTAALRSRSIKVLDISYLPDHQLVQFKNGKEYEITPFKKYTYTYQPSYGKYKNHNYYHDLWGDGDCLGKDCLDSVSFELESDPVGPSPSQSTDNVVPFPKSEGQPILQYSSDVAFVVSNVKPQNIITESGATVGGLRVKGYIPYVTKYGNIDVIADILWTDDALELDQKLFQDHKGNKWLSGVVKESGCTTNGGPWATISACYATIPVDVYNRIKIPKEFWKYCVSSCKCDKCQSPIKNSEADFTSVNIRNDGTLFKVICPECVTNSLPEPAQHALIEARLNSLQNEQQVSQGAFAMLH